MENIKELFLRMAPYWLVKDKIQSTKYIGSEDSLPPDLYNAYGERMKVFYLQDTGCLHTPYTLSSGRVPRYILWDRFNIALKTHFYVHEQIFEKTYDCENKIAVLRESEEIIPRYYDLAMKKDYIMKEFSKILTHSERILNKYENAEFFPACGVWYGTNINGGNMDADACYKKIRNISVIASAKESCELHKLRSGLARHYDKDPRVDAYGAAVGKFVMQKAEALESYRYSIAVENCVTSYYFTEKIMDCFASMTVPIYVGATKIGDFFNVDGIIQIDKNKLNDFSYIDSIIQQCNEDDYANRRDAIIDNYYRVQKYTCIEDYIYNKYPELN